MADVQPEIAKLSARLVEIETIEKKSCLALAESHEASARTERLKYQQLKIEAESIRQTIGHQNVINETVAAKNAATQSQAVAESASKEATETLTRLAEKEKTLDELIAKASAANEKK